MPRPRRVDTVVERSPQPASDSGGRLWIWLRRFGAARSSGVHLTHDRLYLGRISPVSGGGDGDERPRVRRVAGQVAIGWSTEPAFIGSFRLRPKFE